MEVTPMVFQTLKKFRVNVVYRRVKNYLPNKLTSSINTLVETYGFTPLVLESELRPQYKRALSFIIRYLGARPLGDFLEFGVCPGTSLICMHSVLKELNINHVRLFGFDSFEGLPAVPHPNSTGEDWVPGNYRYNFKDVVAVLSRRGINWKRTFLVKGWFSDTLKEDVAVRYNLTKASLIMIDCDLYSSAKESLNFCQPLIKDRTIIFFDDWSQKYQGEAKAFDEFLKENQHIKAEKFGSYKPNGQIFLVTNTLAY